MKNKKNYDGSFSFEGEGESYYKEAGSNKWIVSKYDFDLFDEEKNLVNNVYRVKLIGSKIENQKWKIFENDKVVFALPAKNFSKRERDFLSSLNGVNFILNLAKSKNIKSLNNIKKLLKTHLLSIKN